MIVRVYLLVMLLASCISSQAHDGLWKWNNPPRTPHPILQHHSYQSRKLQAEVGYSIYLPPGYEDEANITRYPVVYWLHGRTGSEIRDLLNPEIIDSAIRENKVAPVIVVYANGGAKSWYTDSPDGVWLAETTVTQELIPHIDATWRTIPTREARAIQGMSMGGAGALKFAFRYPELFSSVVSFAASLRRAEHMQGSPKELEIFEAMFGGSAERFTAEHPFSVLELNVEKIRGNMAIKVIIGTKDKVPLVETNLELHKLLESHNVEHEYVVVEGVGHSLTKLGDLKGVEALQFAQQHFTMP